MGTVWYGSFGYGYDYDSDMLILASIHQDRTRILLDQGVFIGFAPPTHHESYKSVHSIHEQSEIK